MQPDTDDILKHINEMPDIEKLKIVDSILKQLDKPDPEIDKIWKNEAKKRWKAYKEGKIATVPYDEVMKKNHHLHRKPGFWENR